MRAWLCAAVCAAGCFDFAHLSSQYGRSSDGGADDLSVTVDGDGGSVDDLSGASSADLTPPVVNYGTILLATNFATNVHNSFASAIFFDPSSPEITTGSTCTRATAGSCVVEVCPPPPMDLGPAPDMASTAQPPNAGTITVSGTMPSFTLNPGLDGTYTPYINMTMSLFGGGENLTFQATGGDVPAFTQTLLAPAQVQLISPGAPGQTISRASDYTATWTGGSGELQLVLTPASGPQTNLVCNVSAGAASVVIASSLLMQLPMGSTALLVQTSQRKSFFVGVWRIGLSAAINGVFSGSGGTSSATFTLQ
jgi:hypothetical protein